MVSYLSFELPACCILKAVSCRTVTTNVATGVGPGWLYMVPRQGTPTARRVAFDSEWTGASRRYDPAVHGLYNSSSGLPFFGADTSSGTVWDTSSGSGPGPGDALPDLWGSYVYDTVWAYAYALANITARSLAATDGAALREALLQTQFEGITGTLKFDTTSQDRVQEQDLHNIQVAAGGSLSSVEVSIGVSSLQWLGGVLEVPDDGTGPDPKESGLVRRGLPGRVLVGTSLMLDLKIRNSFDAIPPVVQPSQFQVNVRDASGASVAQVVLPNTSVAGVIYVNVTFEVEGIATIDVSYKRGRDTAVELMGSGNQIDVISTLAFTCSPGSVVNIQPTGPECKFCEAGTYENNGDCVECPRGTSCSQNSTLATINVSRGYWRYSVRSTELYRCSFGGGGSSPCLGGLGTGFCAADHSGPKCEVCPTGILTRAPSR